MPTRHNAPSLYEMLYGNFTGGLDLHQVSEENQVILSVLIICSASSTVAPGRWRTCPITACRI